MLGCAVMNVHIELHDLTLAHGTSMPMLTAAVAEAIYLALKDASPCLLEPMMNLEVMISYQHFS